MSSKSDFFEIIQVTFANAKRSIINSISFTFLGEVVNMKEVSECILKLKLIKINVE